MIDSLNNSCLYSRIKQLCHFGGFHQVALFNHIPNFRHVSKSASWVFNDYVQTIGLKLFELRDLCSIAFLGHVFDRIKFVFFLKMHVNRISKQTFIRAVDLPIIAQSIVLGLNVSTFLLFMNYFNYLFDHFNLIVSQFLILTHVLNTFCQYL